MCAAYSSFKNLYEGGRFIYEVCSMQVHKKAAIAIEVFVKMSV